MHRTVRLLLETTPEQANSLKITLEQFTACFNEVCKVGWQSNQKNGVKLHHATYKSLKSSYPKLVSDLIIQARVKAVEALISAFTLRKNGKRVNQPNSLNCSARYNQHTFRINWIENIVNLSSVNGRLKIHFNVPRYATKYLGYPMATADLIYRKGKLWLNLVIDIPAPEIEQSTEVVGVDLGINRPAVMSNNKFLGERRWKELEQRTFRLKRKLQRKGTKAAKRHLKKLAGKQLRRRRDHDHVLSKRIVETAPDGSTIVFEDLKNIRKNARQRKGKQQRKLHGWSFAQLRVFAIYKAEERGKKVVFVDPRNSSKGCSRCDHIHRANRPTQSIFKCQQCNFQLNADLNAARNIRQKHLASVGKSDAGASQSLGVLRSVCLQIPTPATGTASRPALADGM